MTTMYRGHVIVFAASWADYEEDGWCIISRVGDQYYEQSGGHSVMVTGNQEPVWNPLPTTEECAFETMLEWEDSMTGDGLVFELFEDQPLT